MSATAPDRGFGPGPTPNDLAAWTADLFRLVKDRPGYCVGRDGTVWSRIRRGYPVKFVETWHSIGGSYKTKYRYRIVGFDTRSNPSFVLIHRLVLETFVGQCPPGMVCCHYDGNPRNNRLENLRWDTEQANLMDSMRHGTFRRGERRSQAKLTDAIVLEIRRLHAEGLSTREIMEQLGTRKHNVQNVLYGRAWTHVQLPSCERTEALP